MFDLGLIVNAHLIRGVGNISPLYRVYSILSHDALEGMLE
jgi:hypothetical protein